MCGNACKTTASLTAFSGSKSRNQGRVKLSSSMSSVSENDLKRFILLLQTSYRYVCEPEREREKRRDRKSIIFQEKANDPVIAGRKVHNSKEELIEESPILFLHYSLIIRFIDLFSFHSKQLTLEKVKKVFNSFFFCF